MLQGSGKKPTTEVRLACSTIVSTLVFITKGKRGMWSYYKGHPLASYTTWKKSHLSWVCILPTHRTSRLTIENAEEHSYPQLKSTKSVKIHIIVWLVQTVLYLKNGIFICYIGWQENQVKMKEMSKQNREITLHITQSFNFTMCFDIFCTERLAGFFFSFVISETGTYLKT